VINRIGANRLYPGSGDSAWAMNRRAEFGVVK